MIRQTQATGLLCLLFALGLSTTGVLGVPGNLVPELTVEPGLSAQDNNLALVDELMAILDDPEYEGDLERMFDSGRTAPTNQGGFVGSLMPETTGLALDQQQRSLDVAGEFLALNEASYESDLHRAVALAKEGTYRESLTLGLDWADPVPLESHTLPTSALAELFARHGVEPTPQEQARIDELDELNEPLRTVLARFVDAFLALDTAARIAYVDADTEALERLLENVQAPKNHDVGFDDPGAVATMEATPSPGDTLQNAGVDLTLVLPTRNQFLDAILDLDDALTNHGTVTVSSCAPIQVPPVFSIDLANCDNLYTQDFALLIDAGGDDVYHNNAGGAGTPHSSGGCSLQNLMAAAALVDLGGGNNEYGGPENPQRCGANGGGVLGVGFLLDAGGNDTYSAGWGGTNGGGFLGVGFLLDGGGDDMYTAGNGGTNGGASTAGAGFLLDANGDDMYTAGWGGTNGGGASDGAGFLLDGGGDDMYTAGNGGTNGGASTAGAGFLLDANGNDTYTAGDDGTNGGGVLGVGFLLDADGNDTYTAGDNATNGGGWGGVGFLLDAGGNDTYTAGDLGTNGGGVLGVGFLLDADGTDYYQDPAIPGDSCWDCTVVLKGETGTQLDSDDPLL